MQTFSRACQRTRTGWIADAVVYGVVPHLYDPPGFNGVTNRLDDLADLGVGAIWLSPVTGTLPGNYGYAVTDYFDVRPDFGTQDDLRNLVQAAHERGIRVLMDFVPNHTSIEHPYFQDATAHGEASPYWDYYDRDDAGAPTHYFHWTDLPNLNFENPEVRRVMLEAITYWVRACDVDGFRIDAVWGIKERNPEWLTILLTELRRIKPDALLIAEASARDPFYGGAGFDAAYDWTDTLGHWAWENVFTGTAPIGQAMVTALTNNGRADQQDALVLRFLNNNDTGARFLTTHGVACYRVALAMLLTLPGLPCLFTGDEAGAEFHPYTQRDPIDWTDRHGLRADTKRLIALRRQTSALHSRTWLPLAVEPDEPCFAFLRTDDDGTAPVVVLLNFSASDLEATITLTQEGATLLPRGDLIDLWTGEPVAAADDGRLTVSLPAWGFRMVTRDCD